MKKISSNKNSEYENSYESQGKEQLRSVQLHETVLKKNAKKEKPSRWKNYDVLYAKMKVNI